jgi:hypothetical protein
MNKPDLSTMNALDINAFRNQLRDVVILGFCRTSKIEDVEEISDVPAEELLKSNTFDDGSSQHAMCVIYRIATPAELKAGRNIEVEPIDQLGFGAKVGFVKASRAMWSLVINDKTRPAGWTKGELGKLPNYVVEWYALGQLKESEEESANSNDAPQA